MKVQSINWLNNIKAMPISFQQFPELCFYNLCMIYYSDSIRNHNKVIQSDIIKLGGDGVANTAQKNSNIFSLM